MDGGHVFDPGVQADDAPDLLSFLNDPTAYIDHIASAAEPAATQPLLAAASMDLDPAAWMAQEDMQRQVFRQQQQQQQQHALSADWQQQELSPGGGSGFLSPTPSHGPPLPDPSFCLQDNWNPDIADILNEPPLVAKENGFAEPWQGDMKDVPSKDLFSEPDPPPLAALEELSREPMTQARPGCDVSFRLPSVVLSWLRDHEGVSDVSVCQGDFVPLSKRVNSRSVMGEANPLPAADSS